MDETALNPYQSPIADSEPAIGETHLTRVAAGTASGGRYLAAQIDIVFAMILFFVAAMSLADDRPFQILPGLAGVGLFLGYFFFSEWLLGTSPGKFIFGLCVRQISGERCTVAQIAIRTSMRIVEANPLMTLPACICILFTSNRQRIGDLIAGTVVVRVAEV